MTEALTIAGLRSELGISLDLFAQRLGLNSRSRASEIERGAPVSLPVALKIEELSGGRIDAAQLNADVAAARAACGNCVPHAPLDSGGVGGVSSGKDDEISGLASVDAQAAGLPVGEPTGRAVPAGLRLPAAAGTVARASLADGGMA